MVDINYVADGVHCRIEFPLEQANHHDRPGLVQTAMKATAGRSHTGALRGSLRWPSAPPRAAPAEPGASLPARRACATA